MPKIIQYPSDLMKLSRDELDELLLEEYKNPALLRELVRMCLSSLREETKLTEFYREKKNDTLDKLDKLRNELNEVIKNNK